MSGRLSRRCLLYYLCAILACGSARGVAGRAYCPSCGQDRPDVLASPWYPRRESDRELRAEVVPFQSSPYFRLRRGEIFQDATRNDDSSRRSSFFYGNHESLPRQRSATGYPLTDVHPWLVDRSRDSFLLHKRETLSQNEPESEHPLLHIFPSTRLLDEPTYGNLFFRIPRNKYSTLEKLDFKDDNVKNPVNDIAYRADEKPEDEELIISNWDFIEDPSTNFKLDQSKQTDGNFFEMYPVEDITAKNNNEQINYDHTLLWNTPELTKDEGLFFGNWNFEDSQELAGAGQFEETKSNWPQTRSTTKADRVEHFLANEEDESQEYFEDASERDSVETEETIYNSALVQHIRDAARDKALFDEDLTMRENSRRSPGEPERFRTHPAIGDTKYFQDEETKDTIQDEAPELLPKSSGTKKSPGVKSVSSVDFAGESDEKSLEDEIVIETSAHAWDPISKDTFDVERYNCSIDSRPGTEGDARSKSPIELDPDLMNDVEEPPAEPTEPTPVESFVEFSTLD